MNCEEALKRLYDVIDKEASEIDTRQVEEHLSHCKHCMARYEFESMFKTFVTEKASCEEKTDHLRSRIMDRIDATDSSRGGPLRNPFKYKMVILSAAAALVICIVAAFAAAKFYRHKVYTYPFEQHHMAAADFATADAEDFNYVLDARHFITNDMHLNLTDNNGGFQLVSLGYDEIQDQKFVHLRYDRDNVPVSLFIGDPEGVRLPDFERAVFSGVEYFRHVCAECQVIYWYEGNAMAVVVSEDKQIDLTSFIPALASL